METEFPAFIVVIVNATAPRICGVRRKREKEEEMG
jgi:hypothetical protein